MAEIIRDPKTPIDELPRYFRAFDFQHSGDREPVLLDFVIGAPASDSARRGLILVEAVKRFKNLDASKKRQVGAVLEKVLPGMTDKSAYISLVVQFGLGKNYPAVLALAQQNADGQLGVNAVKALIDAGQQNLLRDSLASKDPKAAAATAKALSTAADARAVTLLIPLLQNNQADLEARRLAVRGMAQTRNGAAPCSNWARQILERRS